MNTYEIIMGQSIGPVRLGMPRKEVQAILGDYEENLFQPYGSSRLLKEDISEDFIVSYDADERANFICFTNFTGADLTLDGNPLSEWCSYEFFIKMHELDPDMDMDSAGFTSNALGFGVTFRGENLTDSDGKEYFCEVFDTLQVVTKDYWKDNQY